MVQRVTQTRSLDLAQTTILIGGAFNNLLANTMKTTTHLSTTSARYSIVSIALHWLMLMLLVAVYACMELSDLFPKGSDTRAALKTWHYMLGLTVFLFVWVRLAARLAGPSPGSQRATNIWQARLAKFVQIALYGLMVGLPLAGWLLLSARGKAIPFFGWQLPALMAENRFAADWIKDVHETGASAGYFLVGLHTLAALWHHYFLRDDTLRRMLPKFK